ncbi:MAG: flagellar hook-basal body complex protein FliE [Gammaproteobacteria bacterium]|nr:flagellar hook-basal body complex protein FliE [Gammaproteobacteria bacterium]MDH5776981.1 flagellar hook-basal body complex protein FliE [Gammaproteobacteria bacterium]
MANNTINSDTLLIQMRAMAAQAQNKTASPEQATDVASFSDLLKQSIKQVNELQQEGSQLAEAFQKGDPNVQMSEVMVSLQKANVSFQAMLEVRNKLVSAYQEIMNMQV